MIVDGKFVYLNFIAFFVINPSSMLNCMVKILLLRLFKYQVELGIGNRNIFVCSG